MLWTTVAPEEPALPSGQWELAGRWDRGRRCLRAVLPALCLSSRTVAEKSNCLNNF